MGTRWDKTLAGAYHGGSGGDPVIAWKARALAAEAALEDARAIIASAPDWPASDAEYGPFLYKARTWLAGAPTAETTK